MVSSKVCSSREGLGFGDVRITVVNSLLFFFVEEHVMIQWFIEVFYLCLSCFLKNGHGHSSADFTNIRSVGFKCELH